MSAQDVLKIENIEQRMVALKYLGAEEILKACGGTLVDSQEGYELYALDGLTSRTEYALMYACPSDQRVFVSFVKPEVGEKKDAILAIASKWKRSVEQWRQIGAHS